MTVAMAESRGRARLARTLLEAAVVLVFVLLVWSNYTLRRQQTRAAAAVRNEHAFVTGERIGVIPTLALDGTRRDLDLRTTRAVVAIVDPRCDSCRALLADVRGMPDVRVISVAPLHETRAGDVPPTTLVLPPPLPAGLASRFGVFPQLLVIDRGAVVRTCANVAECV